MKKKYRLKKKVKIILVLLLIIIIVIPIIKVTQVQKKSIKNNNLNNKQQYKIKEEKYLKLNYDKSIKIPTNILEIVPNSNPSIVISDSNGKVLASINENIKREGASTTKIFTGYASLILLNKNDKIVGTEYSLKECNPYCKNNIKVGEELTVKEAATYTFPDSSNSTATDIAVAIGKKYYNIEDEYEASLKGVEKINEFIKEIGCNNTHLGNANGLNNTPTNYNNQFDENGYPYNDSIDGITANDLQIATINAMQNKIFRESIPNYNTKGLYFIKSGKGYLEHGVWGINNKNKRYYISILGVSDKDSKTDLIDEIYKYTTKELIK